MTGPRDIPPGDGDDPGGGADLAAEYALGLLSPSEAAAFEARLEGDAALRADLAFWQERLAGLADAEVPPIAPPARLKGEIEATLFGAGGTAGARELWLWRGLAAVATLAAAALAVALLRPPAPDPAPAPETAPAPAPTPAPTPAPDPAPAPEASHLALVTATPDNPPLQVATLYDEATGRLTVSAAEAAPPPGRVLELWLIAPGAPAPASLGLIAPAGRTTLTVPPDLTLEGGTLAISEEPPGGSPTGAPTGTVLGTGAVTPL
jgi:anti-sigma-K factor RskA